MIDPQLLVAARGGDPNSMDALLRELWPDAFRISFLLLRDRAAAEDSAQDALARVWATLDDLNDLAAFPAWFYRLVVNGAKMQQRGAGRRRVREETSVSIEVSRDEDDRIDVNSAIRSLPEWLRVPVVLHY